MGIAGRGWGPSRDVQPATRVAARARATRRAHLMRTWAVLVLFLGLLAAPTTAGTDAPAAAAPLGCSTGSGGPYAAAICWLDLSNVVPTSAGPPNGQTVTLDVGGAQLSMNVRIRPGSPAPALAPKALPVWVSAAIAGTSAPDTAYHGVAGLPALGTTAANTNGQVLTLSDIALTIDGVAQTGYRLVVADAESTGAGESITVTSTSLIDLLADIQPAGWVAPCSGGATGLGTTSVTCQGAAGGLAGARVLVTTAPTAIDVSMNSGGGQAVAFGLIRSSLAATATVTEPAAPGDTVTVTASNGLATATATTSGTDPATTAELATFGDESAAGTATFHAAVNSATSTLADFVLTWSCTQDGAPLDVTASADGADLSVPTIGGGQLTCQVSAASLRPLVVVTASVAPETVTAAGTTITLTYAVENQSLRAVSDLTLTLTAFSGSGIAPAISCAESAVASGAATTCTATYVATQDDIDAGGLSTATTVSLLPEAATAPVSYAPVTASITAEHSPGFDLTTSVGPTVDTNKNGVLDAGDTAPFRYVLTNTGNVTLQGVAVHDPAATSPVTCEVSVLAPGASTTCGPIDHPIGTADLIASPTRTVAK